MSKVVCFTDAMQYVLADKINVWLLEHPGYRIATVSVVKGPDGVWNAWVAFETV